MDFETLIAALPVCPNVPIVDNRDCKHWLEKVSLTAPQFVPPTLTARREIQEGRTALILVEAPGAVGKTMLAREIARRTGAVLWDLAKLTLGNNTLRGTVGRCYGNREDELYDQVITALKTGDSLVIMDALDEGRLGSGEIGFEAFLDELSSFFREPRSRPSAILLARRDAAEYASVWLESSDVPYAHLTIDFFDKEGARHFIDKYLDVYYERRRESPIHRRRRQDFEEARDAFFERAMEVIGGAWTDPAVRGFLGYAPILEGISVFLSRPQQGNYRDLAEELRKAALRSGPFGLWELLGQVVEDVLVREHRKVSDQMKKLLAATAAAANWDAWETLYLPQEQRQRLLAHALERAVPSLPPGLPAAVRDEYEKAVGAHLAEHPFAGGPKDTDRFANVAFRDDVYGWALASTEARLDHQSALRARMLQGNYTPSVILGWSLLGRRPSADGHRLVAATDFGFIYEALRSYGPLRLELSEGEMPALLTARLLGQATGGQLVELHVGVEPEGIRFPRHLSEAKIDLSAKVTLGTPTGPFYLGPSVELSCRDLFLESQDVVVNTGSERVAASQRKVILRAGTFVHGAKAPHVEGGGVFEVRCSSIQPPWDRWAIPVEPPVMCRDEFDEEICRAIRYLANRGPAVVNLEDYQPDKDAIGPVEHVLRAAGILVDNPRETRGNRLRRPAVPAEVRMLLLRHQADIARGILPDEIRRRLKTALRQ